MKIAVVFPGQGSQKVGMGQDIVEAHESAKAIFDKGSAVLGRDIASICFEGPQDVLTQTENAQAGLFLVSAVLFEQLKANGIVADIVAGHSLGELTAYYAAGVYDLEMGLSVINARGKAMAKSHPSDDSAMAAIMKLDLDVIQSVLESYKDVPVVAANLNCPGQIVISGQKDGVEAASKELAAKGGRAIPLPVSGAFHSPLMQSASEELADFVSGLSFSDAQVPIVLNRLASSETNGAELRDNLSLQVISSVRWIDSIQYLASQADIIIECGSGRVLSALIRKINPDVQVLTVSDQASLDAAVAAIKES